MAYCADLKNGVRHLTDEVDQRPVKKRCNMGAATNRSEEDEKVVCCKPTEAGPGLALPGIDAQAGSNDLQGNGNDIARGYSGDT